MDDLKIREKEIFETLNRIKDKKFVVIGGYSVNSYTLSRFSVDCDIVVENDSESKKIEKELLGIGYSENAENNNQTGYYGEFKRYEKEIKKDFSVSIDILIKEVKDRQTNAIFTAKWIFDNSEERLLKGKTILEELKLRIINLDALFVMKVISCRKTDIRDVFMLAPEIKDEKWIQEEISKRYDLKDRISKIEKMISSKGWKDGLQGVFGYIPKETFKKHIDRISEIGKKLKNKP